MRVTQRAKDSRGRRRGGRQPLSSGRKVLGGFRPTLDTTCRNHNGFSAQGRRGREADPDSRSASEQGGSAKREKPCEQGRRHLAVNSQVSDKAAGSAEGAGGFERTAFQVAFFPHRAKRGKRKIGRFSKALENISFCLTSAVPTRDSRPAQSAALSTLCASKPSNRESLPRGGRSRKSGRLLHVLPPKKLTASGWAFVLDFLAGNPLQTRASFRSSAARACALLASLSLLCVS